MPAVTVVLHQVEDLLLVHIGSAAANRFVAGYHKAVTEITDTASASQEQLRAFWPDAEPAAGLTLLQGVSADGVPPPDFQQHDTRSMSHMSPLAAADPVTPFDNQQQANSLSLHGKTLKDMRSGNQATANYQNIPTRVLHGIS